MSDQPFDVVAAFRAGQKIRKREWPDDGWIQWPLMTHPRLVTCAGHFPGTVAGNAYSMVTGPDHWEPFIEPVKHYNHVEAARLIDEGKTVASKHCGIARWNKDEFRWNGMASVSLPRIANATDFVVVEDVSE